MASFDVIVRGATVVDGGGAPARTTDVGIAAGRIVALTDLSAASAASELEAGGHIVCPGFIDVHTHSDVTALSDPRCASKVRQGVTTELVGHCGFSAFPLTDEVSRTDLVGPVLAGDDVQVDWHDCDGYLKALERARPAFNVATLVGNGTVRAAVMGYGAGRPSEDDLVMMQQQVAVAMEQGAFGLSSGLTLYPSRLADKEELVALCEEVGRREGIYDTHTRHLAGWHFKSVEEAIEIGRQTSTAVQVAHLCIIDPRYWGEADQLLAIIEAARKEGVDVTFDVYPYLAAGCPFNEMMPEWIQDGGSEIMLERLSNPEIRNRVLDEADSTWAAGIPMRWNKAIVSSAGPSGDPAWIGKSIAELAQDAGLPPEEMMLDLLIQSRDRGRLIVFNRIDEDVDAFISHPVGMIGSDGRAIASDGPRAREPVHPRFYGSFPRVLAHYVRERNLMPMEEAIRKMTSLPADRLGLKDRGRLAKGCVADLVVFDPATVKDQATFDAPHQYPAGISHVMVNGEWVVEAGEQTDARPGQVLRNGAT